MEKYIEPALLSDNCDKKESLGYTRQFTPEELAKMKDDLADVSIEIDNIEVEKKEVTKSYNDDLKVKKTGRVALLKNIRFKSEFVNEECYKFIDHDAREVGYYNSKGQLVYQRPIRPDEMQKSIFEVKRTGTEG